MKDGEPFMAAMRQVQRDIYDFNRQEGNDWSDVSKFLTEVYHYMQAAIVKEKSRVLLFPDMTVEQYNGSETFVFAAPCTKTEWHALKAMAIDDQTHLPYVYYKEDKEAPDVGIILRYHDSTDAQALETAAWMRITQQEFSGIIYAMKYDPRPPSTQLANIIARTAGANPKQVSHIDLKT
ncbi:hypothetical protein MNBD_GAMMA15-1660 [hydrothermal vent metagenome]|uniref:Uncharacterized protein n=1 Tax=hydrothermal vent metagenome TaxID=652676 RepID=A0A3B0ZG22_9ZZZZ